MVDVTDIQTSLNLELWLESYSREVSVSIASRAVARVMPIWADYCLDPRQNSNGLTPLSTLRSIFLSSVAAKTPTDEILKAADAARLSAPAAFKDIQSLVGEAGVFALTAIKINSPNIDAAMAVRDTGLAVLHSASADEVWENVRRDAAATEVGTPPALAPLWYGDNPLLQIWKQICSEGFGPDTPYDFWRRWYDSLLDPIKHKPFPQEMLYEIALIEPGVWDKGAEAVAKEIAKIEARYGSKSRTASPVFDGVAFDDGTVFSDGTTYAEPVPSLSPASPSTTLARESPQDALARNAKVIQAQLHALFLLVDEELEKLRGSNGGSEEGSRKLRSRVDILEEISRQIKRMREAFEIDLAEPGTALVAVSEALPVIADKAEEMMQSHEDGRVPEAIIVMAASVEKLTEVGVSPDEAAKYAAGVAAANQSGKIFGRLMFWRK